MSDRLVRNLIVALAVLAAGYALVRFVASRGDDPASAAFDLAAVAEVEIDSAVFVAGDERVALRGGSNWTVNGYEATPEAGDVLARALEQARMGQLVSRNPANHERLGVAEGQGRHLTIYAGGEGRLSLIVSEEGRSFDDAYVRRPGDDEVWLLRGNLADLTRKNVDGWRDKQIVSAVAEEIQRLEFVYPAETQIFTLVRDSAAWRVDPWGEEATGDVSRLVREVASLRAIGFAPDSVAEALTWETPTAGVRALGPGGAMIAELAFIAKDDTGYYVKRKDDPVIYSVSQFSGDQILKRAGDLISLEEPDTSG